MTARRAPLALAAALALVAASGCGNKKKQEPIGIPPPQGAASLDELSTAIGQARGLNASLAPTSTKWRRVVVIDDKRAVLAGEVEGEAVALMTENGGRTWRSLRTPREGWSAWSVGADGAVVLAMGPRTPPQPSTDPNAQPAGESLRLFFAAFGAPELSAPSPAGVPKPIRGARHPVDVVPAVLSADRAALILDEAPGRPAVIYGGLPGAEAITPARLPPGERVLPAPYGRPPMVLSARGRDLLVRPFPAPGKPLDPPQKVPGVVVTPAVFTELSAPPACELEGWSFQVVTPAPGKSAVVAISPGKSVSFALPGQPVKGAALGCGAGKIAVEVQPPKVGNALKPPDPTIAVCTLEGSCILPDKPPFRPWAEPHDRSMAVVPTAQGAVAVLTSRAAVRWGLYFSQSLEGKLYEVPRVIGEGTGDRGRIELGALLALGSRVLLLLEADVTGTSRRGWYVTVSDDGGLTWNPP